MSRINQRLNGLNPLSYIGVDAVQPTDFITQPRDPTPSDSRNFLLGTWWLNTATQELFYLASLSGLVASWVLVSGASGAVISLTGNTGVAVPTAGNINVLGSHGINTSGAASTLTVAINNAITLGDLSNISPGTAALTLTTGDLVLARSNQSSATNQMIRFTTNTGADGNISMFLNNVFIGQLAGNTTTTGIFNVGIGSLSCSSLTTGVSNTAVGNGSLQAVTTGTDNTAIGYVAGNKITTGAANCAIGDNAIDDLLTGSSNSVIGTTIFPSITTGSFNCGIGHLVGGNYTTSESSNILIGYNTQGTVGESNALRIGNGTGTGSGQLNKSFIAGIRGITTGVNDAVPVLIDSLGQLGVTSSTLRAKENIVDMGSYSSDIMSLRPVVFNYKVHSPESKSVGLIAEEVSDIAPSLVVYDNDGDPVTVRYNDLVPMLLNELQKLSKRVKLLEGKKDKK